MFKMINEIINTQVTEMLANYAISLLQKGIDYETFANLTCTFGYCIKGVRLNLNEEKYL